MKVERLNATYEDGTPVVVVKTTKPIAGYPGMYKLPEFKIEGGPSITQAQGDTNMTRFRVPADNDRILTIRY